MSASLHAPVLKDEVIAALAAKGGEIVLDGTFGAGGYSRAILESADCKVVALDRDPNVQETAEALQKQFPDHFLFIAGCFADMVELLAAEGIGGIDGVVLDIGVSSMQIDQAERGFSFQKDGPLDMRMSQSGRSAADIVNEADEAELADMLYYYGEERRSRAIARAIIAARALAPITRTLQLAEIVRKVVRSEPGKDGATRTFQALRIAVNDELGQLTRALEAAESLLKEGGRLIVVTFHSLEDRLVKKFLQSRSGDLPGVSRHLPQVSDDASRTPTFLPESVRLVNPGKDELRRNPRARSAKMRVAIRNAVGLQL